MTRFLGTPVRIERSAGAVVYRCCSDERIELLLIRDRYGNWGLPKGHIEANESAEEAAIRECREETGLERTRVVARLGTIDWYFRFGEAHVHKYCDFFLLEAAGPEEATARHAEGVHVVRWVPAEAAVQGVTYENTRQIVRRALAELGARVRAGPEGPESPAWLAEPEETSWSGAGAATLEPGTSEDLVDGEERTAKQVFLTGGTGFVGGHLARELAGRGHQLRALVRDPRHAAHLRELGAELVQGDVTRPETLGGALDGCDAVVHLVGIIREKRPRATFRAVHVEGTRNLLMEAGRAGVVRFVHMSALGAKPEGAPYHRTKFEAEEAVRAADLPHVIFRPAIIAGEGSELIALLTRLVRLAPIVPIIGSGAYRLQPVAIEDVARAFALALDRDDLLNRTFELGGPHKLTYNRLVEIIGEELGRDRAKLHVPLSLVRPIVDFATRARLPTPITSDELAMLLEENVVQEDDALRKVFGIEPTPLRAVLQRLLESGSR